MAARISHIGSSPDKGRTPEQNPQVEDRSFHVMLRLAIGFALIVAYRHLFFGATPKTVQDLMFFAIANGAAVVVLVHDQIWLRGFIARTVNPMSQPPYWLNRNIWHCLLQHSIASAIAKWEDREGNPILLHPTSTIEYLWKHAQQSGLNISVLYLTEVELFPEKVGLYDSRTGEVWIKVDPQRPNTCIQTLLHELGHSAQTFKDPVVTASDHIERELDAFRRGHEFAKMWGKSRLFSQDDLRLWEKVYAKLSEEYYQLAYLIGTTNITFVQRADSLISALRQAQGWTDTTWEAILTGQGDDPTMLLTALSWDRRALCWTPADKIYTPHPPATIAALGTSFGACFQPPTVAALQQLQRVLQEATLQAPPAMPDSLVVQSYYLADPEQFAAGIHYITHTWLRDPFGPMVHRCYYIPNYSGYRVYFICIISISGRTEPKEYCAQFYIPLGNDSQESLQNEAALQVYLWSWFGSADISEGTNLAEEVATKEQARVLVQSQTQLTDHRAKRRDRHTLAHIEQNQHKRAMPRPRTFMAYPYQPMTTLDSVLILPLSEDWKRRLH